MKTDYSINIREWKCIQYSVIKSKCEYENANTSFIAVNMGQIKFVLEIVSDDKLE